MAFISYIVFGLVAGAIAKLIMPGKDPGGWIVTAILGILGSVVGGFLGGLVNLGGGDGPWTISGIFCAVIGAIILLAVYRLYKSKTAKKG